MMLLIRPYLPIYYPYILISVMGMPGQYRTWSGIANQFVSLPYKGLTAVRSHLPLLSSQPPISENGNGCSQTCKGRCSVKNSLYPVGILPEIKKPNDEDSLSIVTIKLLHTGAQHKKYRFSQKPHISMPRTLSRLKARGRC